MVSISDNTAGVVTRRGGFRRLEQSMYLVPVVVEDGGYPIRSSTGQFGAGVYLRHRRLPPLLQCGSRLLSHGTQHWSSNGHSAHHCHSAGWVRHICVQQNTGKTKKYAFYSFNVINREDTRKKKGGCDCVVKLFLFVIWFGPRLW